MHEEEVEFDSKADAWKFFFGVANEPECWLEAPYQEPFSSTWMVRFWVPEYWMERE